jgi:acyl carrier protein
MTNLEKYKKAFIESLSIKNNQLTKNIEYNSIPEWDSIGHMSLMSALEEAFSISFETDDIIDFSSFEKGKEILNRYKIKV